MAEKYLAEEIIKKLYNLHVESENTFLNLTLKSTISVARHFHFKSSMTLILRDHSR